jgi:hypothetical protein
MITTVQPQALDLFGSDSADWPTPIANELRAFFDRGGSTAEAVQLVSALERAAARTLVGGPRSKQQSGRGSRLCANWQPSAPDVEFAIGRGLSHKRVSVEAEKFRNYWTAKSGAGAIKRDWSATWRNWIIGAMERDNGPSGTHTPSRHRASGSDAILAGVAAAADRRARERGAIGQHRQVQTDVGGTGIDDLGFFETSDR